MKRLITLLLIITSLLLTACTNKQPAEDNENENEIKATTKETIHETNASDSISVDSMFDEPIEEITEYAAPIDHESVYADIIRIYYDYIIAGDPQEGKYEGFNGFSEPVAFLDTYECLDTLGYYLTDINNDSCPELIFGDMSNQVYGSQILAMYAVVDNEPALVFEGWSRSSYYICTDNSIYHEGSNGASDNCSALYTLPANSSKLNCDTFLFTGLENGSPAYYSNSEGEWDPDSSATVKLTSEEHTEIEYKINKKHKTFDFISFDRYRKELESTTCLKLRKATELFAEYSKYDKITVDSSEYAVSVVITSKEALSDLQLFGINYIVYDEEGNAKIDRAEAIYTDDIFETYEALEVTFVPGESLPTLGVSYTDSNGNYIEASINESGFDGSIYLSII